MSCCLCVILSIVVVFLVALKIYAKVTTGWCKSQTCLVGKTAIVTGSNTGIGYETALDFAKRGARVILACRDRERATKAQTKIIEETGNPNVLVKIIDMASFESIRAFAKDIIETEKQLDILVNNAAAAGVKQGSQSKEGLLLEMHINYFGPVLLTLLLIDLLKKTKASRIVNVASEGAKMAKNFAVKDLNSPDKGYNVYFRSKLCNILFTVELNRRLKEFGVSTYSLHPGAVKTEIFRHAQGALKMCFIVIANAFFKTSEEGAQTTIYCSVTKGIEDLSGHHFSDCRQVAQYKTANVPGLARELWDATMEIIDIKPNEIKI